MPDWPEVRWSDATANSSPDARRHGVRPAPTRLSETAKIPRAGLLELATRTGSVLDAEERDLLPCQLFLLFKQP